jgi:hypothetical protein
MESQSPLNMRRAEAARYIRETYGIPCTPATLAKYACLNGGPIYRKAGLDAWANRRLSKLVRSTSELTARGA